MATWLTTLYVLAIAGISVYGLLGLVTLFYYWRHRQEQFPCPPTDEQALPAITIQLPIYNERFVVRRLIDAAVGLDYPAEKLQIQVVDDSDDDTTELVATLVAEYAAQGVWIEHVQRTHRQGYKAGALEAALSTASGELVAIFDADFCPNADFLQLTVPHFLDDPNMGMIQARWGHLNDHQSPLTAAQAIALDKHFAIEQTVRHRADLFPKFNGAAGIWRRRCIEDAGGWDADTVTEDLDLSTRAVLKGWGFRFLVDVVAPAELPASISAYKNQQARWAKGSTQCLVKFGGQIWSSPNHSRMARLYALLSMSAYSTHLLLLTMLLLIVPLVLLDVRFSPAMMAFGIAGAGQPLLFVMSQQILYADWGQRLRHFPTLLVVAIGIAPSNARAILGGLNRKGRHPFVRTPKGTVGEVRRYQLPLDWIVLVEMGLAIYAGIGLTIALQRGNFGPLFLLFTCTFGFGYVAFLSLRERFQSR